MECHKRGCCCRCSQGTQLDPSLLVNEGSQAEQIEAGDVFWKQDLFSSVPCPCQRASGWTMLKPMFLIGCLKPTFGCRKRWKFSTSHWSTKISQAFQGFFPLGQNQGDLVVCFFSGLYWSSGYQRCCFITNLEVSNENSGDLAMEFSINLRSHGFFLDQAKGPRHPLKGVRWRWSIPDLCLISIVYSCSWQTQQVPGVAEFWAKLMKKHIANSTSSSVKQHGFNVQNLKLLLHKLQVVGFRDIDHKKWHEVPKC